MNVAIIEDEYYAQLELSSLLHECSCEIEILACLDSIEESVRWLSTHPLPELIFMDIQLSDGLSFEIFRQVDLAMPVIFTTAYDEYALRAFEVNSVDYLLKPVALDALQASLRRYEAAKAHYASLTRTLNEEQIEQLLTFRTSRYKTRFLSKTGDRLRHIPLTDIAYFYADNKTAMLVTWNNQEFLIDHNLGQLCDLLDPALFYRVNRQYLVHVDAIEQIVRESDGRLKIRLRSPCQEELFVSRPRVAEFLQWLDH